MEQKVDRACVVCGSPLEGRQRLFDTEACKQAAKYQQVKGERCRHCKKPMKPVKILGGFKQECGRKTCIKNRKEK